MNSQKDYEKLLTEISEFDGTTIQKKFFIEEKMKMHPFKIEKVISNIDEKFVYTSEAPFIHNVITIFSHDTNPYVLQKYNKGDKLYLLVRLLNATFPEDKNDNIVVYFKVTDFDWRDKY